LKNAQAIPAHESPRTTKLYDRTSDEITLDEVERICAQYVVVVLRLMAVTTRRRFSIKRS